MQIIEFKMVVHKKNHFKETLQCHDARYKSNKNNVDKSTEYKTEFSESIGQIVICRSVARAASMLLSAEDRRSLVFVENLIARFYGACV